MATSDALREVFTVARPLVEQWLDVAEQIAALREVATNRGLDWSQLKALLKAQIQDERDESGDGKRVKRIVEKAEFASAYADMLGLANMNENNFSHEEFRPKSEAKQRETSQSQHEVSDCTGAGIAVEGQAIVRNAGVTAGETAPIPPSQPESSPDLAAIKATGVALTAPVAANFKLRPNCQNPDLCAGVGKTHCHACTKSVSATLQHEAVA